MKTTKSARHLSTLRAPNFCLSVLLAALLIAMAGCTPADTETTGANDTETPSPTPAGVAEEGASFSYSNGIDENGFWEGIVAGDYVALYDYSAFPIPKDTHTIADDAVQSEINTLLESYAVSEQITDRSVADGDTVNIDYVGSVDGVEFDGGNTGGTGTEVTIGVTSYIDDFLEQLIGQNPGETFNVNVTFPEDYGVDNLNGKDAVFVTTINYIVNSTQPELTDAFVAENLAPVYGYTTVQELRDGVSADLRKSAIQNYIYDYLINTVAVDSIPDSLIAYQQSAMIQYYQDYANNSGVSFDEFLTSYLGVGSLDELIENNVEGNRQSAKFSLLIQAIAEDAQISATTEDIANYMEKQTGSADYAQYEDMYGMPYLKQMILSQKVMDYLSEHTVLE
jgi:trigger factor